MHFGLDEGETYKMNFLSRHAFKSKTSQDFFSLSRVRVLHGTNECRKYIVWLEMTMHAFFINHANTNMNARFTYRCLSSA
jgi:hypothetical protein